MASDNAIIPLTVSWWSDELPIPSFCMLWMHDEMEIQPSSPMFPPLIYSTSICKMQQNWLTAVNLNAYIVMSFMNCLWCNSEQVKSLWAHSIISCFWSHTSYMKTNYCWIAVNILLNSFKKIFNSLSILEERIWPKIEPVSQSLQTPSTQQRYLIVILHCIQEVDPFNIATVPVQEI